MMAEEDLSPEDTELPDTVLDRVVALLLQTENENRVNQQALAAIKAAEESEHEVLIQVTATTRGPA